MKNKNFCKASSLYHKITDGTHDSPKSVVSGKYLVTSKNIKNNCLDLSLSNFISIDDYNRIIQRSKVDQWDVIISMIGEYCGYTYIEKNFNTDYAIKNVGLFKTNNEIEAYWLSYYLKSDYGKYYLKQAKSGSSQPYISLGSLRELPIYNPSQKNKFAIVSVLKSLDDKIELNNQINTELEAMAKTLYDYWFVQFDFPDENGKPYKSSGGKMVFNEVLKRKIPDGWEFVEIETLLRKNESAKKVNAKDYLLEGNLPVIDQSTDFIAGFTNDLSYKIIYKDEPAIIFGDHTRILKLINFDFARGADGTQVIYSNNIRMPQYLFFYSLKNIDLSNYGYARHFKFLKSSKILLPSKEQAKLFNDKVKYFYKKIVVNQKQNQELGQLRDWLLPMLMNGQVRVGHSDAVVSGLYMVAEEKVVYKKI